MFARLTTQTPRPSRSKCPTEPGHWSLGGTAEEALLALNAAAAWQFGAGPHQCAKTIHWSSSTPGTNYFRNQAITPANTRQITHASNTHASNTHRRRALGADEERGDFVLCRIRHQGNHLVADDKPGFAARHDHITVANDRHNRRVSRKINFADEFPNDR